MSFKDSVNSVYKSAILSSLRSKGFPFYAECHSGIPSLFLGCFHYESPKSFLKKCFGRGAYEVYCLNTGDWLARIEF